MLKGKGKEARDPVISIIGPGTTVTGDLASDGTIRIEGVVLGTVEAGTRVVVGREGRIEGDVSTGDAVVSGTVHGAVLVRARLEVQSTARIDGEVRAERLQLEEGAVLNGRVEMTGTDDGSGEPRAPEPEAEGTGFPEPAVVGGK